MGSRLLLLVLLQRGKVHVVVVRVEVVGQQLLLVTSALRMTHTGGRRIKQAGVPEPMMWRFGLEQGSLGGGQTE